MVEDTGIAVKALKVDGGASADHLLMQFQSDILGIPLHRPIVSETTAVGAAFLAGLAVGFWKDLDDVKQSWNLGMTYEPKMDKEEVERLTSKWKTAVECTKMFK